MNNRFLHPRLPGTEKGNRHNHKRFSVRGDNSPPGSVDTTRKRTKKHSTLRTLRAFPIAQTAALSMSEPLWRRDTVVRPVKLESEDLETPRDEDGGKD